MKVILIANPKGGSGKTTLSTNIAGYLASRGQKVAMLDLDRQISATKWLSFRPHDLPEIQMVQEEGIKAVKADWLVIDSPAGQQVIVPISPSLFDIQASRDFLNILSEEKSVYKGKKGIGIVGMRMAPQTRAATMLEEFIAELNLPVLAYLRETQVYVNAAFEGKSLFDLPASIARRELEQWDYLLNWLNQNHF
jgi:chromosome partitioning protein